MKKPRKYQQYSVDKFFEHVNKRKRQICIALYTGTGKTFVSLLIAKKYIQNNKSVLFIAPWINLLNQTAEAYKNLGNVQIIQGKNEYSNDGLIYIASLQTLTRRSVEINPALIIFDEKHNGHTGKSHKKIIEKFPNATYLSLTATPFDANGHPLRGFDAIIKYKNIRYFIDKEYLVDCRCYAPVTPDLSKARKTGNDYNEKDIDHIMNQSSMIGEIVKKTKEKIKNKKCLFFAVTISHAENIAKDYELAGFRVAVYHSKIKNDKRERILKDFEDNKIDILVSVTSLIAGFDNPSVNCLIIGRPTVSISLYRQLVGRGMRPFKGKKICWVYDCAGAINSANLPSMEVIPREKKREYKTLKCKICYTKSSVYAVSVRRINSVLNYVTTWKCKNGHFFEVLKEVTSEVCKNCSKILQSSEFRENSEKYEVFAKCECGEETIIRTIPKNNYKLKKIQHAGIAKIKKENILQDLEDQSENVTKFKDYIIEKLHPDMHYSCLLSLQNNKNLESNELKNNVLDAVIQSAIDTNQFKCLNTRLLKVAHDKTSDPINIINIYNCVAENPMQPGWLKKTTIKLRELKKIYDSEYLLELVKNKCREINKRGGKMAALYYYFENLIYKEKG